MSVSKRNLFGAPIMGIVGATKYYGPVQALKAVSLNIRRGQVHAVVGENGAGKSTLIGIAAGAVRPDFAVLRVAGKEIKRPNARKLHRAGVAVTLGSTAMVAALKKFDVRRIAILTPHQPRGDEMVKAYFLEAGFDVVRLKGLACKTPRLIAQVPQQDIGDALRELDGPDVEAMLTVGTALPSSAVAAEAERLLNKPVIAVNTVSFWHALRRCGIEDRVHGHGRVLEEL
jgi:maleate cis-trans isomerase